MRNERGWSYLSGSKEMKELWNHFERLMNEKIVREVAVSGMDVEAGG